MSLNLDVIIATGIGSLYNSIMLKKGRWRVTLISLIFTVIIAHYTIPIIGNLFSIDEFYYPLIGTLIGIIGIDTIRVMLISILYKYKHIGNNNVK